MACLMRAMATLETSDTKPLDEAVSTTVRRPAGRSASSDLQRNMIMSRLFPQAAPRPQVGRFELLEVLGRGGMGVVYKARDPRLDRFVAIKLLIDEEAPAELKARLVREAKALARLSHPNVVQVYEAGEFEERVFLAIEFIEGGTLGDALGDVDGWRAKLDLLAGAGRGLAAAHEHDIVHRDFKPANVLVGSDGVPKVTDFGIARAPAGDVTVPSGANLPGGPAGGPIGLTSTGTVMGTPAYMSPEQICGDSVGPASDQFSFCVVVFEALTGKRPFVGASVSELRAALLMPAPVQWPASSEVPSPLRAIILRGLESEASERWPSMQTLLDALDAELQRVPPYKRVAAWSAGLSALALAGWGLLREPKPDCADAGSASALLTAERLGAARAAFEATGLSFASTSADTALANLATATKQIDAARADSCKATYASGTQSPERFAARSACFDRLETDVDALLGGFAQADAQTVQRAVSSVERVFADASCERPPGTQGLPADEAGRAKADQLLKALRAARLDAQLGRWGGAESGIERVRSEAESLDAPRVDVELELAAGALEANRDDHSTAREHFDAAVDRAEAAGLDPLALQAWRGVLAVSKAELADVQGTRRALRRVEALGKRLGRQAELEHDVLAATVAIAELGGDLERAERGAMALVSARDQQGASGNHRARARFELAEIQYRAGKYTEAIENFSTAYELWSEALGAEHPRTLMARRARLAPKIELGKLEGLDAELAALRALYEADPDHTANERVRLAIVDARLSMAKGDLEGMLGAVERGITAHANATTLSPALAAQLWNARGTARYFNGEIEGAVADYRTYLAMLEKGQAPRSDQLTARANLAEALSDADKVDEALTHFELVEQGRMSIQDIAPEDLGVAQRAHATALARADRKAEAREKYQSAIANFQKAQGYEDDLAATRELLAKLDAG